MRVIKKVMELQGAKKLKLSNKSRNMQMQTTTDVRNVSVEDAKREFWKLNSVSSYASNFGATTKHEEQSGILKYQKFGQLAISGILKQEIKDMIDNWLSMNDVEDFTLRIYTTVRDMYTVIKNQNAPVSHGEQEFKWVKYNENLKAPRIDQLIEKHRIRRIAAAGSNGINKMNSTVDESFRTTIAESSSPTKRSAHYYMFGESPKAA